MKERDVIKYNKNRNINEYNTTNGLGNKYFEALGRLVFCYTNEGLHYFTESAEDIPNYVSDEDKDTYIQSIKEMDYQNWISNIMDGKEFLKNVECGGFIDYDGSISAIYVDGYISNLGLIHNDICQGDFLVDGEVFSEICDNYHVLVDWANK